MKRLNSLLLAVLAIRSVLAEDSWPQFRGPTGQGLAATCLVPDHFDQKSSMQWRTEIDGKEWSSPVVADGKIFCHFGSYGTWCLNTANSEVIWKKQLIVDHSVGSGSSPIVHGKHLVVVCDGIDSQYVAALSVDTGEEVWRTPRPPMTATNGEMKKAYSTPIVIEVDGKTQIAAPGAQWVCSYDPMTGDEIWRAKHGEGFSTSPSAVFWNGMVVFSTGFMRPELVAVRADGKGDVTNSHIAWRVKRGAPNKPSPVIAGGNPKRQNGLMVRDWCFLKEKNG